MKKIIYGLFVISFVVALGLLGLYNARVSEAGEDNNHQECRWGEWEDTTDCIATECGNPAGVKGQQQECTIEINEYSCPVVHWEYDWGRLGSGSFDVEYNKSSDPNKCHRPSVNQLKDDYGMNHFEAIYFTQNFPQWKDAEVSGSHIEVVDTRARRTECRLKEVLACGTIRWCFENDSEEHPYRAEAIPNNEDPEEGFRWEEGMDKWCEFPEVPTPPELPVVRQTTEASAPVCPNGIPVVVPVNSHVIRDGSDATVNAHIPEGNRVNIYFRENGVEGWTHAERDIPVEGKYLSHTIHELNPAVGYDFGIQASNGCAGGEVMLAVVVDPPANGVLFPFSYWEWLR